MREFAVNPHAWAVLGRNLIPVAGIYLFGWSAALAVFSYWFDGLTALMAIITAMVPRALRESRGQPGVKGGLLMNVVGAVLTWVILLVVVGSLPSLLII